MQLAPNEILVNLDVRFHRELSIEEIESGVDRLEREIRARHPDVRRIFIEPRGSAPSDYSTTSTAISSEAGPDTALIR